MQLSVYNLRYITIAALSSNYCNYNKAARLHHHIDVQSCVKDLQEIRQNKDKEISIIYEQALLMTTKLNVHP